MNMQSNIVTDHLRPVTWEALDSLQKLQAIETAKALHPEWSYTDLADYLGTTHAGISGVIFRHGKSKPNAAERPISKMAQPVVQAVFRHAKNAGLTDVALAKLSGYSLETLWGIRQANRGTRLQTICDIAEALGLEIVVRPK